MILFYKNGNTLKIHNPSAETKYYQMPSVNSVLATEDDLTKVTTVSSAIKKPVILTPANNSTGFNGDITFTGFETIETFTGTLDAISIAIATDVNFANVVVLQRIDTTDTNGFNIAVDLSSSDLYIKVKYHSDLYSSVWSNVVKTTTPEYIINKPTIIGPTNGQTGVALFPMISGSDFTYVGVDETHESTTYQIAKDVTFTNIAYNVTSTTDLTSHLITEDLDYETTYYIRMRYNGSKYGNSEWSNTVVINTLEVDEKIISFWNSNSITFTQLQYDNGDVLYAYYDVTNNDVILVLLDLNLNIKKSKRIKKILFGITSPTTLVKDDSGNVYINLAILKDNVNVFQSLLIKLDNNLNFIKATSISGINSPHTSGYDMVYHNNHLYVAGYMNYNNSLSHMILKLDLNLNLVKKYLGDTGVSTNCQLEKIRIINNNVYVSGHVSTANTNIIAYMAIFDLDLNRLNHKAYYSYTGIAYGMIWNFIEYNNFIYATGNYRLNNSTVYEDYTPVLFKLDLDLNVIDCKILNGYKGVGRGIVINQDKLLIVGDVKSDLGGTFRSFILEMDQNLNAIKSFKFTNSHINSIYNVMLRNKTLLLEHHINYYVDLPNYTCRNLVQLDSKLDSSNTLLESVNFTWTTVNPIIPIIDIIVNTTFSPTITNHTLTIENNTPLFDIKDL